MFKVMGSFERTDQDLLNKTLPWNLGVGYSCEELCPYEVIIKLLLLASSLNDNIRAIATFNEPRICSFGIYIDRVYELVDKFRVLHEKHDL